VFLDAWLSLGVQLHELLGSRGLLPAAELVAHARDTHTPWRELPTIFYGGAGDLALTVGVFAGIVLALLALVGAAPRVCVALSTFLYLSYVTVGRTFFSFQWDNLLLECGFFAIFLPRDRRAPWIHFVFRAILFKLYWESGIAKWQSHLGDWQDGSAMTAYYQTAPLPTWVAFYAHALPVWWHHLESWATLGFELILPFAIFGPRVARLFAFAFLTFFQLANAATANYGFFVYLALVLHVFLLDDRDVERGLAWLRLRLRRQPLHPPTDRILVSVRRRKLELATAAVVGGLFVVFSVIEALVSFTNARALVSAVEPLRALYTPFRVVNSYHLFGHITTERIEPEVETFDGEHWVAHDFRHKAGEPARRPGFVAPHQPRLDFQLWFYGLSYQHGTPPYVANLLDRVCNDPSAVEGLFAQPLPPKPESVRLRFYRYQFTTPSEKRTSAAWWRRTQVDESRPLPCS
jgi:hypothetical protein